MSFRECFSTSYFVTGGAEPHNVFGKAASVKHEKDTIDE